MGAGRFLIFFDNILCKLALDPAYIMFISFWKWMQEGSTGSSNLSCREFLGFDDLGIVETKSWSIQTYRGASNSGYLAVLTSAYRKDHFDLDERSSIIDFERSCSGPALVSNVLWINSRGIITPFMANEKKCIELEKQVSYVPFGSLTWNVPEQRTMWVVEIINWDDLTLR